MPWLEGNFVLRDVRYWKTKAVAKTISITDAAKFVGNKHDFHSNERNKKGTEWYDTERLRQKECHVIQAECDADVHMYILSKQLSLCASLVQPPLLEKILIFSYCFYSTITWIAEISTFSQTKGNIRGFKQLLGKDVYTDLLFAHAFTGSDTTSRIFGVAKNQCFRKSSRVILSCMAVPRFSLIHRQTRLLLKVLGVKQWCHYLMGQSLTLWPQLGIVI